MQHVVRHVVRSDSSAVQCDRVKIAFILAQFQWLKPFTDEAGEETVVPEENPPTASFLKPEPRLEPAY